MDVVLAQWHDGRMSIIATPEPGEATGEVAKIYAEDTASLGYVPSHTRVMAINPEAYRAWENLIGAIAGPMDKRRYELITLAAAGALRSKACRLAHGQKSLKYISEDELVRIARDYHGAGLPAAEVAMMEFAERLSTDSAAMTDADSTTLREHGFTDREIVDIALAAAARNYYSRALHALGVEVDLPPRLSEPLRSALVDSL
jgi:uncharacterized peroxidase-related enzyme